MSFGLPLRDRILKWQLVSRADSVSPVRGKKQQNQRTNISNIFECSDERGREDGCARKAGLFIGFPKAARGFGQLAGGHQRPASCLGCVEHLLSVQSAWHPSCQEDSILLLLLLVLCDQIGDGWK